MAKRSVAKMTLKITPLFSKSWQESDVVLRIEGKEIHAHRCILSLQSKVFKTLFNGNFKDALEETIELKDDKYKAMISFLMLLYPANMLGGRQAILNDDNILQVMELADKYEATNVIKQCMKNVRKCQPKTAMYLLPFAERNRLPLEEIIDVIKKHVSMDDLNNFSQNLSREVLAMVMLTKGKHLEDIIKKAQTHINEMRNEIQSINRNNFIWKFVILFAVVVYNMSNLMYYARHVNDIVKSLK